jgi:hypothetical protein
MVYFFCFNCATCLYWREMGWDFVARPLSNIVRNASEQLDALSQPRSYPNQSPMISPRRYSAPPRATPHRQQHSHQVTRPIDVALSG